MRRFGYLFACGLIAAATPAWAGEEILYRPAPEWVEPAELPPAGSDPGKPIRLIESQVRLDGGTVWEYRQMAVALETPEALSGLGTITANWLPDKGDLIVHAIELLRDGKPIDVLDDGVRFEVLRREQQLEQRVLDGGLTATLAVPGLRLGDTIRVAYSITKRDQALDDEMEWSAFVAAEPMPLASGRNALCWYSGIWDLATQATLPVCLKAVEQTGLGYAALDSRAVVLFRLGKAEEALVDLNKALAAAPGLHASRYMRGIVRLSLGDRGGREDLALALAAEPALAATYGAYGFTPPE